MGFFKKIKKKAKKFTRRVTNTKGLRRTVKRVTNPNGLKRFVKRVTNTNGLKRTLASIAKLGKEVLYAPLVPFRGTMRTSLKKKGINNPPKKLSKLAPLFANVVVLKKSNIDPMTAMMMINMAGPMLAPEGASQQEQQATQAQVNAAPPEQQEKFGIAALVKLILSFFQKSAENPETEEEADINEGMNYDYVTNTDQDEEDYLSNINSESPDLDLDLKKRADENGVNADAKTDEEKKKDKKLTNVLLMGAGAYLMLK
jgi:hypothetical protein